MRPEFPKDPGGRVEGGVLLRDFRCGGFVAEVGEETGSWKAEGELKRVGEVHSSFIGSADSTERRLMSLESL